MTLDKNTGDNTGLIQANKLNKSNNSNSEVSSPNERFHKKDSLLLNDDTRRSVSL